MTRPRSPRAVFVIEINLDLCTCWGVVDAADTLPLARRATRNWEAHSPEHKFRIRRIRKYCLPAPKVRKKP